MPTLGDLVVNITANTKAFDGDVNKAKTALGNLDKNVLKFGKNMTKYATLPILAAGAGLVKLTTNLGKNADKLLDLEQITGLSTTTLQEFQNVATVAGVSFEGLTGVIQKFSSRLPTIEAGTSETAKAFDSLGVALKDSNGEVRTSEDLFPELITALQDIENVTERNATAQQVFGRSLGDLAPVLGLTADETRNARNQAHELGLVLEREAILKANEYRVETELLTKQLKQQGVEIGSSLIPVFQEMIPIISEAIRRWNKKSNFRCCRSNSRDRTRISRYSSIE
jgi:TP901 family phage tail tape measure protein